VPASCQPLSACRRRSVSTRRHRGCHDSDNHSDHGKQASRHSNQHSTHDHNRARDHRARLRGYLAELPALVEEITAGTIAVKARPVPLAEVERAWAGEETPACAPSLSHSVLAGRAPA
jgi:hypothetical protein